jgi:Protein of unknown function (DUF3300)
MVAAVALYPDALLMQVLIASTYPLEVVEADRWCRQQGERPSGLALCRRVLHFRKTAHMFRASTDNDSALVRRAEDTCTADF